MNNQLLRDNLHFDPRDKNAITNVALEYKNHFNAVKNYLINLSYKNKLVGMSYGDVHGLVQYHFGISRDEESQNSIQSQEKNLDKTNK